MMMSVYPAEGYGLGGLRDGLLKNIGGVYAVVAMIIFDSYVVR